MSRTLTISELRDLSKRLPEVPLSGDPHQRYKVAMNPSYDHYDYRYRMRPEALYTETIQVVEFRAEPVKVNGARCIGWYYHDLLVKVCV